jgi:hypothetical protein
MGEAMSVRFWIVAPGLILVAAVCALGQDRPTTRPGDPVFLVMRLHNRTELLDLPADEKSQVDAYLDIAEQQAEAIDAEIADARPAIRMERTEAFMQQVRARLAEILPPRQYVRLHEPAASQPARADAAGFPALQRFRSALDQLDLTPDQKLQVAALMDQVQPKLQEIRQARAAGLNVRQQVQAVVTDIRGRLLEILTPTQRQDLRQILQGDPATRPAAVTPRQVASQTAPRRVAETPVEKPAVSVAVGAAAPAVPLLTPGGATVPVSRFKDRVLVLEFGSITSPTFRDHVAEMERLQQEYTGRVFFLVVYTHEAFPAGGRESSRNQEDGISVEEPNDLRGREAVAEEARSSLHITIPMVIDGMDNAAATAYGGFPNAAIIIGRDGKIAARQQWTDPSGLGRLIDVAMGK